MKTLIISEKPSVAQNIATTLGSFTKKEGYLESGTHIISWALGHLLELAEPQDYDATLAKWRLDALPILPVEFKIKGITVQGRPKQLKLLTELINRQDISEIVNACDAGREGELIFRRIYNHAQSNKPTKRLWLNENTPSAVKKAFTLLIDGTAKDNLAAAAEARSRADWVVGINATRAFTVKHNTILSVGRVQTPTLALIVNREREILNFNSANYWEIDGTFITQDGQTYTGKLLNGDATRFEDQAKASQVLNELPKEAKVDNIEVKENTIHAPQLFNLSELQITANKRYGFNAQETLDLAQTLYEKHKILTYPRTDSKYLTQAIVKETIKNRLTALSRTTEYAQLCAQVSMKQTQWKNYVDDKKVTDHHAIIPTDLVPNLKALSDKEKKIYDLVVRRFLGMFYPPYQFKATKLFTKAGEHLFLSKGKINLDFGWKVLQGNSDEDNKDEENQLLPDVKIGETVTVEKTELQEKSTNPPKRFTDASLLSAMVNAGRVAEDEQNAKILRKTKGIGTEATRAGIIERLIKVQYIERKKKLLIPTAKGMGLIDLVPEMIKSVELTAEWEQGFIDIEKGQQDATEWLKGIGNLASEVVAYVKTQPSSNQNNFNNSNKQSLGQCPLCQKDVVEYPKSYSCSGYREGCKFTIWKEISSKKITKTIALSILKHGRTDIIAGFKTKVGKPFTAKLAIKYGGKIGFENFEYVEN